MTTTSRNYKIVPLVTEHKTLSQRAHELKLYLAANIDIAFVDGDLTKAAVFQQHLDTLDMLIEHSGLSAAPRHAPVADLEDANLSFADLRDANLTRLCRW